MRKLAIVLVCICAFACNRETQVDPAAKQMLGSWQAPDPIGRTVRITFLDGQRARREFFNSQGRLTSTSEFTWSLRDGQLNVVKETVDSGLYTATTEFSISGNGKTLTLENPILHSAIRRFERVAGDATTNVERQTPKGVATGKAQRPRVLVRSARYTLRVGFVHT
jgi:hypothetical protein